MVDTLSPLNPLRRAVRLDPRSQAELCKLVFITQKHMSEFVMGKTGLSEQLAADLCRVLWVVPTLHPWLDVPPTAGSAANGVEYA